MKLRALGQQLVIEIETTMSCYPLLNKLFASVDKIKIATLNLKNKKLKVSWLLTEHKIDIFCLQETDIERSFNWDYTLELENNSEKAMTGFYIIKNLNQKRKVDFEGADSIVSSIHRVLLYSK